MGFFFVRTCTSSYQQSAGLAVVGKLFIFSRLRISLRYPPSEALAATLNA